MMNKGLRFVHGLFYIYGIFPNPNFFGGALFIQVTLSLSKGLSYFFAKAA